MSSLLMIDTDETAVQNVRAALDGLGYRLEVTTAAALEHLEVDGEEPALILGAADQFQGGSSTDLLSKYSRMSAPVPVLTWSTTLSAAGTEESVLPRFLLAGIFEGIPEPLEVLLSVSTRFAPRQRGAAVQRLLKLLARPRRPVVLAQPAGGDELSPGTFTRALVSLATSGWSGGVTAEPLRGPTLRFWLDGGSLTLATDGSTGGLLERARELGLDKKGAKPPEAFSNIRDELSFLRRVAGVTTSDRTRLVRWQAEELLARACAATQGRMQLIDFAEPPCVLEEALDLRSVLLGSAQRDPSAALAGRPVQEAWFVLPRFPHEDDLSEWALDGTALRLRDFLVSAAKTRITAQSVAEALEDSGAGTNEIFALLGRLEEMGYLRFIGSPYDEATSQELVRLASSLHQHSHQDHFEFLGLDRNVDKKTADAAVLEASRRLHPDSLVDKHPRIQALSALLFSKVREAGEVLSDVGRKQGYLQDVEDARLRQGPVDPERAKVLIAKGQLALNNKRYADAESLFAEASRADPDQLVAQTLRLWACFLADPAQAEEGIKGLRDLARLPAAPVDVWYYLGRMYLQVKDEERARKCFGQALKLSPDHVDSKRQLRLLEMRGERGGQSGPRKKSLLDRWRGR